MCIKSPIPSMKKEEEEEKNRYLSAARALIYSECLMEQVACSRFSSSKGVCAVQVYVRRPRCCGKNVRVTDADIYSVLPEGVWKLILASDVMGNCAK